MAKRILDGPNKGYYTLIDQVSLNSGNVNGYIDYQIALTANDYVYHRYYPLGGKAILGTNRTLLPYAIDPDTNIGYYYIRKTLVPDNLKRLTYGLENGLIPNTGNTELFNINFDAIKPPADYKANIDPCVADTNGSMEWCTAFAVLAPVNDGALLNPLNKRVLVLGAFIIALIIVLIANMV